MLSAERFRATDHRKSRRYKYPISLDFSPIMCYNIVRNEVSGYGEGSDTGKRLFIGCSLPLRRGVKALLCGRELTGALSADSDLSRAIGRSAHAAPRIRDRDGRARAESSRRGCHGGIPCGSGSGFAGGAGKRLPFGGSEGKKSFLRRWESLRRQFQRKIGHGRRNYGSVVTETRHPGRRRERNSRVNTRKCCIIFLFSLFFFRKSSVRNHKFQKIAKKGLTKPRSPCII